jgi:2-phosphosulfolactate phosphatase
MEIRIDSLVEGAARARGTVVAIDTLRAFTTAAVALQRGARRIVMVGAVDEALRLRAQGAGELCVGERSGRRPEGFDVGNSPAAMAAMDLADRSVILSTSNGTAGVLAALEAGAERVYAGSLATAAATAAAILRDAPAVVTLVALGQYGVRRAEEDEQTALYLRNLLEGRRPDAAALSRYLSGALPAANAALLASGDLHPDDRAMALAVDSIPLAIAVRRDGNLVVGEAVRA